jgi:hypothetical protein
MYEYILTKQKKHVLTKENMERPAPMEQVGDGLYPVVDDNYLMQLMCCDARDFSETFVQVGWRKHKPFRKFNIQHFVNHALL